MTQVLKSTEIQEWKAILAHMSLYDFYHLPCYHQIAEKNGEGIAELFYFNQNDYHIALPLLVRPINEIPGLEKAGDGFFDATSVYGYAGPLVSHSDIPGEVTKAFQTELQNWLTERNIVSIFSRLHPFIPQDQVLHGLGVIEAMGVTISIDLSQPLDVQRAQYSKGHKSGVNKLNRLGVVCLHDTEMKYLKEFLDIYYETMDRVNAKGYYYFPMEHFEQMIENLDANIHLFVCLLEEQVICGGIYIECNGIVQSYLGGMRSQYRTIAPRKLEKDMVRIWATESGMRIFHLGGGVGAKKDSLYEFKSGFSKTRHDFNVWKWITNEAKYRELTRERLAAISSNGNSDSFFPAFRIS